MTIVTRSGSKLKDGDKDSKRTHTNGKGSAASVSTNLDASGLRRSARETLMKKQRASSPVNLPTSATVEKCTPPTAPAKRKSERLEKQRMLSPLSTSERGENQCPSSSRKFEKSPNLLDNKSKKKQDSGNRVEVKNDCIVFGKKRLNAHSYRKSFLKSQPKKTHESELNKKLKEDEKASRGDSIHVEACSSKEVEKVAEGIVRNGVEVEEKHAREVADIASERPSEKSSSSGEIKLSHSSRKRIKLSEEFHGSNIRDIYSIHVEACSSKEVEEAAEGIVRNGVEVEEKHAREVADIASERPVEKSSSSGEIELSHPSRKHIKLSEEFHGSNIRDISPVSGCCDDILQSSQGVSELADTEKEFSSNLTELCDNMEEHGETFRGDIDHMGANSVKEVEDVTEGIVRNREEVKETDVGEGADSASEGRCFVLRNSEARKAKKVEDLKISHSSRKRRKDLGEFHNFNNTGKSPGSKCSDDSLQSSPGRSADEAALDPEKDISLDLLSEKLTEHDETSQGDADLMGASIFKEVEDVTEGIVRNQEEVQEKYIGEAADIAPEGPCDGLKNPDVGKSNIIEDIVLSRSSSKHIKHLAEFHNSDNGDSSLVPNYCDNSSQISPAVSGTEAFVDADIASTFNLVELSGNGKGQDETSQGDDNHLEASIIKEVESVVKGIVRIGEEVGEKGVDQTVDSINYGLRKSEAGRSKDIGELSHSNGLNVICPDEFDQFKNRVSSPMSKCNKGTLQLYLGLLANEVVCDVEKVHQDCSWRDKLQKVSTRATSGERSVSGDCCLEKVHTLHTSKRKLISEEVDSDASMTVANEDLGSSADPITSSPSESTKASFLERCDVCLERRRFDDNSQKSKMCFCEYGDNNNSHNNSFVEESIAEHPNLPPFIATGGYTNGDISLKVDSGATMSKLNEGIAHIAAHERMPDSPNFVEYLVPVRLSNVQLEQYCATLLSNSFSLCSCSKNDPVGALRDILISVRKCCDHPYLVDQSLPILLTKDLPEVKYLDVGVNASGKLQILDKILSEIKIRGLRVLVLFQSIGGSGRNCIGDILDDFLRQRFGPDSYERVDNGLVKSKKQAALNMFNNKERMRFVFLLENRACLPSIKLSSVDMVILFDSDWNPLNDLRALQKITIESQLEQIKVFRLYSSCTVEEKVLSLAKQDTVLDSNIQNISCSTNHSLLLWGAYFLFHKLDEFHNGCTPSIVSNISSEQIFLNDVVQELLSQLPGAGNIETKNCKYVLKAQKSGASYSKDIVLLGEKEMQSTDEELPHVLWANVLTGRHPQWKYASEPSQRNRRKVQNLDDLQKKTQENAEAVKKRKKVVSNTIDQNTLKSCLDDKRKAVSLGEEGVSGTPAGNGSHNLLTSIASAKCVNHPVLDQPEMHTVESEERMNLRDSQKNLLLSLQPVILRLSEILRFPDDVKNLVGKFLEYMMNNHQVSRDPVTIFEAFQISLCWSAASLLKYKIDHKESLSLIKQHLKFQCSHTETEFVYEKMRDLKKKFAHQSKSGNLISEKNSSLKDREKQNLHMKTSQPSYFFEQELEDGEIRESPKTPMCSVQLDSSKQKKVADPESGCGLSKIEFPKSCKEVEETHRQRMRKLHQKQIEEFQNFNNQREKEKADLELKHKVESAFIRSLHRKSSVKLEKLKKLDQSFASKREELKIYMEAQQKKLEASQRTASNEEEMMKDHWLQEAKAGRSVIAYTMLPFSDSGLREESIEEFDQDIVGQENLGSGLRVEHMINCDQGEVGQEKGTTASRISLEKQDTSRVVSGFAEPVELCDTVPYEVTEVVATRPLHPTMQICEMGLEMNTLVSESAADTGFKQQRRVCSSDCDTPSLEQTLIDPLLDQDYIARSQGSQTPSLQVPVNELAQPSLQVFELQGVEVSACNMQNSQLDIQTLGPGNDVSSNQVNNGTPSLPRAVLLQHSPSVTTLSTEQSQPNAPTCKLQTLVPGDISSNQVNSDTPSLPLPVQLQQSPSVTTVYAEQSQPDASARILQTSGPGDVVSSCDVHNDTPSLPLAVQLEQPASVTTVSTEKSQPNAPACIQSNPERCNELLQLFEARTRVIRNNVNICRSGQLPQNLFRHDAFQHSQVLVSTADPPSTEQNQLVVPASTCIDHQQRNYRHASFQQFEPVEDQVELLNHHDPLPENQSRNTASQLNQAPAEPPAMEQCELLNYSVSRPNAQSLLHLPIEIGGSGSNLSDPRIVNTVPALSSRPPHNASVSFQISRQVCCDPLQNELENIGTQEEHTIKMYEDEKTRLNYECEKELEEVQRKYNTMIQNAEGEFMQRKKALETNYNIIKLNRRLAVTFRLQCEAMALEASRLQQGASLGSLQQVRRLSSTQAAQRPCT